MHVIIMLLLSGKTFQKYISFNLLKNKILNIFYKLKIISKDIYNNFSAKNFFT